MTKEIYQNISNISVTKEIREIVGLLLNGTEPFTIKVVEKVGFQMPLCFFFTGKPIT